MKIKTEYRVEWKFCGGWKRSKFSHSRLRPARCDAWNLGLAKYPSRIIRITPVKTIIK